MKRTIAMLSLGAMLVVGGFFFSNNSTPTESAMEVEPSILSVDPSQYF